MDKKNWESADYREYSFLDHILYVQVQAEKHSLKERYNLHGTKYESQFLGRSHVNIATVSIF